MSTEWKTPIPNTYELGDEELSDQITFVAGLAMEEIPQDIAGMEAYAETIHAWSVWMINPLTTAQSELDKESAKITIRERSVQKGIQASQLEMIINGEIPEIVRKVRVLKMLNEQVSSKVDLCRTFIKTERERIERTPK